MEAPISTFDSIIYLDIETIPDGEPLSVEELSEQAPGNYKKEESKLKWAKVNRDEEYHKRSLNSLKGRVLCIGLAFNYDEPTIIPYYDDEAKIFEAFSEWIKGLPKGIQTAHSSIFVGHNVHKFDIRWLFQHAVKHGQYDVSRVLPVGRYDQRRQDTNDLFNIGVYGEHTKLDDIAKFLGIEGKQGMDGSEVYDYFLRGELNKIYEYCKGDVALTRKIYLQVVGDG